MPAEKRFLPASGAAADWDAYLQELEVKGVTNLRDIYQAAYDAKYK